MLKIIKFLKLKYNTIIELINNNTFLIKIFKLIKLILEFLPLIGDFLDKFF